MLSLLALHLHAPHAQLAIIHCCFLLFQCHGVADVAARRGVMMMLHFERCGGQLSVYSFHQITPDQFQGSRA